MSAAIDWLVGKLGMSAVAYLAVAAVLAVGAWAGASLNGVRWELKLKALQSEFDSARAAAAAQALADSEARRARERAFTEQLSAAAKEADDAKQNLAALRARASRPDSQLRAARAALTAALNREEHAASAACLGAADAALAALGNCAERYRDMAQEYGGCLSAVQMTEKIYNAARQTCR
jgi:chromosome segregation ATPase